MDLKTELRTELVRLVEGSSENEAIAGKGFMEVVLGCISIVFKLRYVVVKAKEKVVAR